MLAAVCVALMPGGCATRQPSSSQPQRTLVWPPPPEQPRIEFVRTISKREDLGLSASRMRRAFDWLIGSSPTDPFLVNPFGVAFDENDNLCVTDTGANAVCFFDRKQKRWSRWTKIGNTRFSSPVGVAKRNGRIFVADSGLRAVLVLSESGALVSAITDHLQRPVAVVVAGERLFVVDAERHCVVAFDQQGKFLDEFGKRGGGNGEFNYPTHIGADAQGKLLVTDSMNNRVQVFDSTGKFLNSFGSAGDAVGHFGRPKGVAVDSFEHVYVVDGLYDTVQMFNEAGQLLMNFGVAGSDIGEFWLANGVAISRANEIFVADAYNHRLQVFKYVGGQQ
jgi:DNA-binding beta-propeller fold protein YncE